MGYRTRQGLASYVARSSCLGTSTIAHRAKACGSNRPCRCSLLGEMMADDANFEADHAHRHFSASCFNLAWELIEKPDRTAEDDEQMVRLAQASLWHWTQRSRLHRQEPLDRLLAGIKGLRTAWQGRQFATIRPALPGQDACRRAIFPGLCVRGLRSRRIDCRER